MRPEGQAGDQHHGFGKASIHFTNEQSLGFIALDIEVTPATAPTVCESNLLPTVSCMDGGVELLGIDTAYNRQYRMTLSCQPIGAEPVRTQAQHP